MFVRVATRHDSEAIAALHALSWQRTYRTILSDEYLDEQVVEDRRDLWAARFAKFDGDQHHVAVAIERDADAVDRGDAAPATPAAPALPAASAGVAAVDAPARAERPPLAGFVCVLLDEEPELGALLDNLHVAPHRHGRGAGRRLMAHAARWVAAMRPGWPMHLWVYAANTRTVAFYRSIGGGEVDRRTIVTPAGNRAAVLRFQWADPAALVRHLDASLEPS